MILHLTRGMNYTTIEMPSLEDELRWEGRRNLALALAGLAVMIVTLAMSVAALLIR